MACVRTLSSVVTILKNYGIILYLQESFKQRTLAILSLSAERLVMLHVHRYVLRPATEGPVTGHFDTGFLDFPLF